MECQTILTIVLIAAGSIVFLIALGNLFTCVLQDWFIFLPEILPANHSFVFQAPFEELLFAMPDGGKLNALWFRDEDHLSEKGVVLYAHGNRSSLVRWGHLHLPFRKIGYDLLVYDYRGYGKSAGRRTQASMYADAMHLYHYLVEHYPPGHIVLYGRSIGASMAVKVATECPARMLILETPFSSIRDLFFAYYPLLPRVFRFKYRFDNARLLRQVRMPVHILHGTSDWVVPMRAAVGLKESLKPGDSFLVVPNGGHHNLAFFDVFQERLEELLGPN
jgi:hypothetical protein